ncbi:MAG TPA: hypothetical protein EYO18_08600, partial [Candidatus Marinimicrobia bacterium]|nr:hypothetical protein [Candidatus Neomarinimicrobiota bacterium]
MNEKHKIFLLVGIVSAIFYIVIGVATDDWVYPQIRRSTKMYDGIAWHSAIPFLIAVGSGVGWFLYRFLYKYLYVPFLNNIQKIFLIIAFASLLLFLAVGMTQDLWFYYEGSYGNKIVWKSTASFIVL